MKKATPSTPLAPLSSSLSSVATEGTEEPTVTLKLDEKRLKTVPPELVARWADDAAFASSVRELSLRTNQLKLLPREIGCLKNLEVLHLDNNQFSSWPEELPNLRRLHTLTFEGNDQLKELPSLDHFPGLRALRVTRRVNYRIPAKVAAGGGESILGYLGTIRSVSERMAPSKLVVSFDPKAHWIPDKDAPACAECNTRFSVFTWRYHCDLCGKSFCFKELSPQKMAIPYLSPSPAGEVCTDCAKCLKRSAAAFSSSSNKLRIPQRASDETRGREQTNEEKSPRGRATTDESSPRNRSNDQVRKNESEENENDGQKKGAEDDGDNNNEDGHDDGDHSDSSDEAEMDPRMLLEKWKIQSLAKLREETKRGIELMKKEVTETKEKELLELRKDIDILRAQLVAEKKRKDRGKQHEKIEREVALQTELAKAKDEMVVLRERLTKANKTGEQLRVQLKNVRQSTSSMADLRRADRQTVAGTEVRQADVSKTPRDLEKEMAEMTARIAELTRSVDEEKARSERAEAEWSRARDAERIRREQEAKLNSELQERADRDRQERTKSEERAHELMRKIEALQESENAIRKEANAKALEREDRLKRENEEREREWARQQTEMSRRLEEEASQRNKALERVKLIEQELEQARKGQSSDDLRERLAQLQAAINAERTKGEKAVAELEASRKELAQAKNEREEREKKIASLLAAEKASEEAKNESEAKRRQAEERLAEVVKTNERRFAEEKRILREENAKTVGELEAARSANVELRSGLTALGVDLKKAQVEAAHKDALIAELQRSSTQNGGGDGKDDHQRLAELEEEKRRLTHRLEEEERAAEAEATELQQKIGNLEALLEAMRDEVKRAHEAEEEADRAKESNEEELHELKELLKERDNQLRRTRHRMNNRVSQLILGMEEGDGLEALRKQLDEKEKELEEAKTRAMEEGRAQIGKAMKLIEDKAKEMKKMKKQLKEFKRKSKTQEVELEKAQAKVLLYEEQLQHGKTDILSKEKMSLISKIEQLKTHELQLMEELATLQSRQKRSPSFSALPLLKGTTKAKLLGSLSSMPSDEAEQLKKEKKELKEKERKEREEKKERKRKEKEKEKRFEGKDPKLTSPRGIGKKADKKLPQNPVFGLSLEELHQKDPSRTVPRIVERLVEYLEQHQVYETEGIFRKSGRNLSIDALRKEFDYAGQGKEDEISLIDEDGNIGIHEAHTFESLRREKTEQEEEQCREEYLASLVALLKQLPKTNLDLLFFVLKFCNKLSKYAEQTKMTSHNLSLIFSPSLCSPEVPDISYQTQMPKLGGMVKTMMDEVLYIESAVASSTLD